MARHARAIAALTAAALLCVLAGCSSRAPVTSASMAPSVSSSTPPVSAPTPSTTATGEEQEAADEAPDAQVAAAAASFAVATLAAYCRPTAQQWYDELLPYLSQSAGAAFGSVDPSHVQCTSTQEDAAVVAGDNVYRFVVHVTTDAGVYEVLVARSSDTAPWATETIEQLGSP